MSITSLRTRALKNLNIPKNNHVILSLDGGGIRGAMTLELLKSLEQTAHAPCHVFCDMVAGTSTGAIIAGLIAAGKTAIEIQTLYQSLVTDVFQERHAFAGTLINPPAYTKTAYVKALREQLGNATLQDVCNQAQLDLLITAKDVEAGEETFFSCFQSHSRKASPATYANTLLRAALEATMSAPTYFYPTERFVDGGVTAYNNPTLAAIQEAVTYSPLASAHQYDPNKLTVLSFGTGCRPRFVSLDDIQDPDTPGALFWLSWLLAESGDDASDMQTYLLRSPLMANIDFRRFQISLDQAALAKLPNLSFQTNPNAKPITLHDLTDDQLSKIKLDRVKDFPLMQSIGAALAQAITTHASARNLPPFGFDLLDQNAKDLFVTRRGDTHRIAKQMASPAWLDNPARKI